MKDVINDIKTDVNDPITKEKVESLMDPFKKE